MIHSCLLDELRDQLQEEATRGQFKKPPDPAEERIEQILSAATRTLGRRKPAMSLERARRMQADAESYDAKLAKGTPD